METVKMWVLDAGAVALDRKFVQGQLRVGLAREVPLDVELRAGFGLQPSLGNVFEQVVEAGLGGAGEESEVAGVDAHDGDRGAAQPVHPFEQRAVAAVADHHRTVGLPAHVPAVDLFGRYGLAECLLDQRCKLLVDREIESETVDGFEEPADLPGGVGDQGPGKKYDFHRRSFEKIRNFTTSEKALVQPSTTASAFRASGISRANIRIL